jgi:hypothetical protein
VFGTREIIVSPRLVNTTVDLNIGDYRYCINGATNVEDIINKYVWRGLKLSKNTPEMTRHMKSYRHASVYSASITNSREIAGIGQFNIRSIAQMSHYHVGVTQHAQNVRGICGSIALRAPVN